MSGLVRVVCVVTSPFGRAGDVVEVARSGVVDRFLESGVLQAVDEGPVRPAPSRVTYGDGGETGGPGGEGASGDGQE